MFKLILLSLVLLTATNEDEFQEDITENIEPAIRTLRFLRGARFLPLKFVLLAYNWKKHLKKVHPQTIKATHPIIDTRESQISRGDPFIYKLNYEPYYVDFKIGGVKYRIFYKVDHSKKLQKIDIIDCRII